MDTSPMAADSTLPNELSPLEEHDIVLLPYRNEHQMPEIIDLIEKELSEPYIIYTYRYFVNQWPHLCYLAYAKRLSNPADKSSRDTTLNQNQDGKDLYPVGVIVSKLDRHFKGQRLIRGYIAMLSVRETWRGRGIAKKLVQTCLLRMINDGAQEVVLETEVDNIAALAFYDSLGFIREKRLYHFYLSGKDSFRLVLPIPQETQVKDAPEPPTIQPITPYPSSNSRMHSIGAIL